MPVAAFPGRHGWGYDGVGLCAVHEPYGGPDGLKRFVDACHARGLAVVLDVVYNHLGPSGNYLGALRAVLHRRLPDAVGPRGQPRRCRHRRGPRFIVENALMWLRDYHLDGLRLDAVHAMRDGRAVHILEELAVAVEGLAPRRGGSCSWSPSPTWATRGWSPRGRPAGTDWTRSGTTTSTTPCTRRSPGSGRATTATSARWQPWPRR